MKANLNELCKVKLTSSGIEHLRREEHVVFKYNYNSVTRILCVELWHIMNIFGDLLYNGQMEMPFENNEIEIDVEDNELDERDKDIEGYRIKVAEPCCVADHFCTDAANFAFHDARYTCFACGGKVCANCSSIRKYSHGRKRLCNDCQIEHDGNDKIVMKRMHRMAGYY